MRPILLPVPSVNQSAPSGPAAILDGPPFGVGIAIFTVLLASHSVPPVILVAAIMAVVQVQNVCDPTNTKNGGGANFTGTPIIEITKRTLPYQVAVATIAALIAMLFAGSLFHLHSTMALPRAAADEMPAAMFSPPASAYRIAVGDDGSAFARDVRPQIVVVLNTWPRVHAFGSSDDPNASDCARKPYAAYVNTTATTFRLIEGVDLDIGITLEDCGGWQVDEWHDHAVFANGPSATDGATLALRGVARMQTWFSANPQRAANLLEHGLAFAAGDPQSYYFSLFKTVDGNLRVYARSGGPAYTSGLRSNDIVERIDGKYWWEYGTYQSQLRAYDGRPHTFEVDRGTSTLDVQLAQPFSSALSW